MSEANRSGLSRRDVLKATGRVAAVTALAGVAIPKHVYAASENTIRLALVGCGGRGTGAADNALSVTTGPTKLVAMADVFQDRLSPSYHSLKHMHKRQGRRPARPPVPRLRRLQEGDGLPAARRRGHPGDAAGLPLGPFHLRDRQGRERLHGEAGHASTVLGAPDARLGRRGGEEKPEGRRGPDVPALRGPGRTAERIKDGQIGDLSCCGPTACTPADYGSFVGPSPHGMSELLYQIRKFHAFLWASGGCFSDFLIHNIDECCWMKDAWPVEAKGYGGRHYRGDCVDQNFDSYAVEYTFADGAKLMLEGRNMPGCERRVRQLRARSEGHGPDLDERPLSGPLPHLQGPELRPEPDDLEDRPQRTEPRTGRMGRPDRGHSPGPALQRGEARRRGQPGHVDGPHGLPHGPDCHLRRHARVQARVRTRPRQAGVDRFARTAATRSRRQIPRPRCRASQSIANIDACLLSIVPTAGREQNRRPSGFCVLAGQQLGQLPR